MLAPVNRYIVVEIPSQVEEEESLIVLPDDYRPTEEKFVEVIALSAALDVRFHVEPQFRLVVDRSMIEEISVGGTIYNVILDNYVVGMIK